MLVFELEIVENNKDMMGGAPASCPGLLFYALVVYLIVSPNVTFPAKPMDIAFRLCLWACLLFGGFFLCDIWD